jgi:DNA-binding PadR family transcriptional regulator
VFSRLLLGLLRDGHARHGYELITSYRARSGLRTNPGNFYRELAKLVAQGLIEQDIRPRDADPRRIPYRITEHGRDEFDTWMLEPISGDGALEAWVLFADMLSVEDRQRVLERRQEELWLMNKSLARSREDLRRATHPEDPAEYRPAAYVLLRRVKQVTAELEFLEELRRKLEHVATGPVTVQAPVAPLLKRRDHAER